MLKKHFEFLVYYKYLFALLGVFNFLLTPIHIVLIPLKPNLIIVINYTILILTGGLLIDSARSKLITWILGVMVLFSIWIEFSYSNSALIKWSRLVSSFFMFVNFCVLLVKQLSSIKEVNIKFIFGPLLGFVYLGIIGAILFEMTHLIDANSFKMPVSYSGFVFYYFSFICLSLITPKVHSIDD